MLQLPILTNESWLCIFKFSSKARSFQLKSIFPLFSVYTVGTQVLRVIYLDSA